MRNDNLEKKFIYLKNKEIMSRLRVKSLEENKKYNNQNDDLKNAKEEYLDIQEGLKEISLQLMKNQHKYIINYDAELIDNNEKSYYQNFTDDFITTISCDINTISNNDISELKNHKILLTRINEFLSSKFIHYRINNIKRVNND